MTLLFIISFIIILSIILTSIEEKYSVYNQKWYKEAAEKFGDDYYYPLSTCRSDLQLDGTVIKHIQHYKPVKHSTYSTYSTFTKLEEWFIEVKRCSYPYEQLLEVNFPLEQKNPDS